MGGGGDKRVLLIGSGSGPVAEAVKGLAESGWEFEVAADWHGLPDKVPALVVWEVLAAPAATLEPLRRRWSRAVVAAVVPWGREVAIERLVASGADHLVPLVGGGSGQLESRLARIAALVESGAGQPERGVETIAQSWLRELWESGAEAAQPPAVTSEGVLRELENTNRELREFAYIVSHDLKAPLRAIDSLVTWIVEDYAAQLDDDGKEQLALLSGRVKRMQNLIDGVLQYSRIGRIREEPSAVNMRKLVAEVVTLLGVPGHISISVEEGLPTVTGERLRLQQVWQNLISNAIKYMDKPRGSIAISCQGDQGFWRFGVTDNGPGIDARHFEIIFQIFQTLHSKDEYESTGIGLTLVRKIVELHGGRVWVESTVGQGSTFYFTLPTTAQPMVC